MASPAPTCRRLAALGAALRPQPRAAAAGLEGALAGYRVLNLGQIIAGPVAATLLAEFGAEVIKVEHPTIMDPSRGGMEFEQSNRSQLGITLNLREPEGVALLLELVKKVDAVVENFRPGTLEKLGISPDTLREANPALVVTRVSGYGQTGPASQRPARPRGCPRTRRARYRSRAPGR